MSASNPKLRTASDVMSRLRWDPNYDAAEICVGYTDRIHGPMEKALCDFKVGGDIPEHRIQYFRFSATTYELLWDRASRQDCIFGSGAGPAGAPNTATLEDIQRAAATMARIEEERRERKADKLRKLQRRRNKTQALAKQHNVKKPTRPSADRHVWSTVHVAEESSATLNDTIVKSGLSMLTWNVLFDTYETEPSEERWLKCISILESSAADIIALQEVTPRFAKLLLQQPWVKEDYKSTAGVDNYSSLDPHGNLLLWRSETFQLHSHYLCSDGDRQRAVLAALRHRNAVVLFANVHLPADKALISNLEENESGPTHEERCRARRRELAAVVAKLQVLESGFRSGKEKVVSLIAGDFNIVQENDEVFDGYFSAASSQTQAFFRDTWLDGSPEEPGYTYDPTHNCRAAVSRRPPRRLDRIFCGNCVGSESLLSARDGCLIGKLETSESPPSDHYGVKIELDWNDPSNVASGTSIPQPNTAWSSLSPVTSDTMVAVLLDPRITDGSAISDFCDLQSTLPVPHITLLHGFVELPNEESRIHALNVMRAAIATSVVESKPELVFDELSIFEHHASATLVTLPAPSSWLRNLYDALRAAFPQCEYQESRFEDGWSPHVSLGRFGSAVEARSAMKQVPWSSTPINAPSLVIYKRDPDDRQFYALSSLPLSTHDIADTSAAIVQGTGLSLWYDMYGSSVPILSEIQRASDWVLEAILPGSKGRIRPYGSHTMEASLRGISDVDALLEITTASPQQLFDTAKEREVVDRLVDRLRWMYPNSKSRVRCAGAPGEPTIYLLTIKLWPNAPSLDLLLCVKGNDGNHLTPQSAEAERGLEDSEFVMDQMKERFGDVSLFQSSLRLIKLWANSRQIYNAKTGFLGGGGWAVLLAWVLLKDGDAQKAYEDQSHQMLLQRFFACLLPIVNERATVDLVDDRDQSDPLPSGTCWLIRAPVSRGNYGRSTSPSTVATICTEIQRARNLLEANEANFSTVFDHYNWKESHGAESKVLILDVSLLNRASPDLSQSSRADIKAWSCRQLISIVVSLDREHGGCARPMPNPLRSPETFQFPIFLTSDTIPLDVLQELCRDFNAKHGDSATCADIGCRAELRVESSSSIRHLLK